VTPMTPRALDGLAIAAVKVTVCLCTWRRPEQLGRCLDSLAAQRFRASVPPPRVSVVVVDNEGSAAARAACEARARVLDLTYLTEPRRGISFARNRAFDAVPADCDLVAVLDDDETADPLWLDALLDAWRSTGADALQGRGVALFPPGAPAWLADTGYFGTEAGPQRLGPADDGRTLGGAAFNAALVSGAFLRRSGLRCEPALALTGGEDKAFFGQLRRQGGRIAYAHRAVVYDPVPAARARLGYVCRGAFRNGTNLLLAQRGKGKSIGAGRRLRGALRGLGVLAGLPGRFFGALGRHAPGGAACLTLVSATYAIGLLMGSFGKTYAHYQRS